MKKRTTPKRIGVACHEIILSGGLLRFERFAKEARKRGYEVVFIRLSQDQPQQADVPLTCPVIDFQEAEKQEWYAVFAPGAGFPPETIEQFSKFNQPQFGLRVQHILNNKTQTDRFLAMNRAFKPDIVVFNNHHWKAGEFTDFQAMQFHYVVGAVDTDLFTSQPKSDTETFTIGGLVNKNPQPLIDAVNDLPENFRLRLFGKNFHTDLDIHDQRVEFVGPLFGDDLVDFYHNVDCIVHTEEFAGWANLGAEALASGTPLICTPHGTLEYARDEETALVLPAANTQDIQAAIQRLYDDSALRKRLADQGRKGIEQFSWQTYADALIGLLESYDGAFHYTYAPEYGLYGKWPLAQRLESLQPIFDVCEGKTILDLGAAEGVIAREALEHNAAVVHSFEIDQSRVDIANRINAAFPQFTMKQADLNDWDAFLRDQKDVVLDRYDIVFYVGLHHHIHKETRLAVLRGVLDIAKEYVVVRTPQRLFDADNIDQFCERNGFHIMDQAAATNIKMGNTRIYQRAS